MPEIYAVKTDAAVQKSVKFNKVILKSIFRQGNGVFHIQFSDTGAMYIDGRFSNDDEVISKLTHKKN